MPMLPQGVFGKYFAVRSTNVLPPTVLEVVVVALHVEHVEVGKAVAVQVGDAGVAAPAGVAQADLRW